MQNDNPFIKLIALAIVGGVAKSLFGPPAINNITHVTEAAKDVVEAVRS